MGAALNATIGTAVLGLGVILPSQAAIITNTSLLTTRSGWIPERHAPSRMLSFNAVDNLMCERVYHPTASLYHYLISSSHFLWWHSIMRLFVCLSRLQQERTRRTITPVVGTLNTNALEVACLGGTEAVAGPITGLATSPPRYAREPALLAAALISPH